MRTSVMPDLHPFSDLIYEEQTHLAESELSCFLGAVKASYGSEQARISAEDWLDESDLMDSPPRSETRNWRAITVAASARLADRIQAQAASFDARHIEN